MNSQPLGIWTVYDKGTDGRDEYTARLFFVDAGGSQPTGDTISSPDLRYVRGLFERMGLTCITRSPSDAHNIIESWL